jgi:hypothetical protein
VIHTWHVALPDGVAVAVGSTWFYARRSLATREGLEPTTLRVMLACDGGCGFCRRELEAAELHRWIRNG